MYVCMYMYMFVCRMYTDSMHKYLNARTDCQAMTPVSKN